MRKVALGLMVVALVGLAAGTSWAAGPVRGQAVATPIQLVAHYGPGGYYHGYGWNHARHWHPPVVVPYPVYPQVVYPPTYPSYGSYYYGYPYYGGYGGSFQYFGPGGGISIGW
jgi:hypothetical protein